MKYYKEMLAMLFAFLITMYTLYLQSKTNHMEVKQEKTEAKTEYLQEQGNKSQANAETALYKLGEPATKPDWDAATKRIEANKAAEAK